MTPYFRFHFFATAIIREMRLLKSRAIAITPGVRTRGKVVQGTGIEAVLMFDLP
jgi:hypothetical protein